MLDEILIVKHKVQFDEEIFLDSGDTGTVGFKWSANPWHAQGAEGNQPERSSQLVANLHQEGVCVHKKSEAVRSDCMYCGNLRREHSIWSLRSHVDQRRY
jgi:hypothetical protein